MAKLVLWGLNRIGRWDLESLRKALSVERVFAGPTHEVVLGSRAGVDRTDLGPSEAQPYALQYEGDAVDEYFVPIAVKCIGDPKGFFERMQGYMTDEGEARFQALRTAYLRYFFQPEEEPLVTPEDKRAPWSDYWTVRDKVGMFTKPDGVNPNLGLYEVLFNQRQQDQKAVLVGYSQGGLVAHFLAWMDERLIAEHHRAVAGVVTVQAPNRGSPLADPSNADNVARGVFEALLGVLGYPALPAPASSYPRLDDAVRKLTEGVLATTSGARHFDVDALAKLVEAAIGDARAQGRSEAQLDALLSARKWMTGLCPSTFPTAFDDLDTAELDRAGSVLASLTSGLERTYHGAVIGTDNQLEDMVAEAVGGLVGTVVRWFAPGLGGRLVAAQGAYSTVALDELVSGPLTGAVNELALQYRSGMSALGQGTTEVKIPAYAHDFIIPSVSQVMRPPGGQRTPFFLGNVINPKGTHVSGGTQQSRDSDEKRVSELLHELGTRLAGA